MIEIEKHKIQFVWGRGGYNGPNCRVYLDGHPVGIMYPESSDAIDDFIEAIGADEKFE